MDAKPPLTVPSNEHVERLLDEALEETFPASDPIAVSPYVLPASGANDASDAQEHGNVIR